MTVEVPKVVVTLGFAILGLAAINSTRDFCEVPSSVSDKLVGGACRTVFRVTKCNVGTNCPVTEFDPAKYVENLTVSGATRETQNEIRCDGSNSLCGKRWDVQAGTCNNQEIPDAQPDYGWTGEY